MSVVGRRPVPEKFNQDLSDVPPQAPSHAKTEREGLPPGYRMRADAHYVEQLSSRRVERHERSGVAVSETDEAAQAEARDRRQEKLLAQVAEEIAAIAAAANLLTPDGASLARRLSIDLIRAQAWRASWLLRALAMLDGGPRGHSRPRPLSALLEQIRQGLAPECRLAGISLQVQSSDWNAAVSVDEASVAAGVTGAVMATIGLLGQTEGAIIRVAVEASGTDLRSIEVTQDDVTAPTAWGHRCFDPTWTDRPGGFNATIGALSARAAAQQHGGSASVTVGERRGTTIRLNLARTH
jgi:signal transduction histidine kinase